MQELKYLVLVAICFASLTLQAVGQERPSPLDDRGGIPVPKNLIDLKNVSLTFWLKFRKTNQTLYTYVNEAAEFHAYLNVCKRHELNIRMDLIMEHANLNLQAAIPAHYDDPEFELLDPLPQSAQQAFLDDMSSDLYAFEYGRQVAILERAVEDSGQTPKSFCEGPIQDEYAKKYIALLATAKKRQSE